MHFRALFWWPSMRKTKICRVSAIFLMSSHALELFLLISFCWFFLNSICTVDSSSPPHDVQLFISAVRFNMEKFNPINFHFFSKFDKKSRRLLLEKFITTQNSEKRKRMISNVEWKAWKSSWSVLSLHFLSTQQNHRLFNSWAKIRYIFRKGKRQTSRLKRRNVLYFSPFFEAQHKRCTTDNFLFLPTLHPVYMCLPGQSHVGWVDTAAVKILLAFPWTWIENTIYWSMGN